MCAVLHAGRALAGYVSGAARKPFKSDLFIMFGHEAEPPRYQCSRARLCYSHSSPTASKARATRSMSITADVLHVLTFAF
jgi:hypothetical protein